MTVTEAAIATLESEQRRADARKRARNYVRQAEVELARNDHRDPLIAEIHRLIAKLEWAPVSRTDGYHELPFGDYDIESRFGFIRTGKKTAGDLLDGRQWHEFPQVGI